MLSWMDPKLKSEISIKVQPRANLEDRNNSVISQTTSNYQIQEASTKKPLNYNKTYINLQAQ